MGLPCPAAGAWSTRHPPPPPHQQEDRSPLDKNKGVPLCPDPVP